MGRRDLKLDDYNITRYQYRELHNFCLQYRDKKRELADLRDPYKSPQITGLPRGSGDGDATGRAAERALMLSRDLEYIEQAAVEAARVIERPEEYQNILIAVTEDAPLHFLQLLKDSKLNKQKLDESRHVFYHTLARRKNIIT